MRNIAKYEARYVNRVDLGCIFENKYQIKYRQKAVSKSIEKYKHNSILEVGCGLDSQGKYVQGIQEYTIVEPSHEFIEQAKRDLDGKNVYYFEGFFEENVKALRCRNYDFIIVGSLLHELENPVDFLNNIKKISNEETIIHINVPNAMSMHRLLAAECGLIEDIYLLTERNQEFQQHKVFDLHSLRNLICQQGGDVLDSGSYFVKPFTHKQMMRCLNDEIIDEQILNGFEKLIKYMPDLGSEIYVNFKWKKFDYMEARL